MTLVGIAHPRLYSPSKRDALLFDTIELLNLSTIMSDLSPATAAELEWLRSHNVVSERTHALAATAIESVRESPQGLRLVTNNLLRDLVAGDAAQLGIDADEIADQILDHCTFNDATRVAALCRQATGGVDAIPILAQMSSVPAMPSAKSLDRITAVVLNALPVPDESTPWPAILDFRADEEARRSLRRLRVWMRRIATVNATMAQLSDELYSLLDDYDEYLNHHRLKAARGRLEVIVTLAAEIVDDLLHARVAPAARALFAARRISTDLYEAERSAPGRDIAYVAKARDRFDPRTA